MATAKSTWPFDLVEHGAAREPHIKAKSGYFGQIWRNPTLSSADWRVCNPNSNTTFLKVTSSSEPNHNLRGGWGHPLSSTPRAPRRGGVIFYLLPPCNLAWWSAKSSSPGITASPASPARASAGVERAAKSGLKRFLLNKKEKKSGIIENSFS